jgi:hypothetical protein
MIRNEASEIKSTTATAKISVQQEDSFRHQIGLQFREETCKMLHLEHPTCNEKQEG